MTLRYVLGAVVMAALAGAVATGPAYTQSRDGGILPPGETGLVTVTGCLLPGKEIRYRSGRNGGASKASCRVTGTWVRIPPSPPLLNNRKTPLATAPVSALLGLSPVVLLRGLRRIDVRGSNVKACVLHASPYKTRATH